MSKYLVVYTKWLDLLETKYISIELFNNISEIFEYEDKQPKESLISASVWIYSETESRYEKLYDKEWYYN